MNETLVRIHSLADASSDPADGCTHHSPLYRAPVKPADQSSPQHSNSTSNDGTTDRGFFQPAGLVGQAITLIQVLTDAVGSRVSIRVHRWAVAAMGGASGKNQY
jgi:hypothetical protein